MKPRLYLESSLISYLAARPSTEPVAAGLQSLAKRWWDQRHKYDLFISPVVLREVSAGDAEAAQRRIELLWGIPLLEITQAVEGLAGRLLAGGSIPATVPEDALHVAIAAAHGMQILATLNFKHIANAQNRRSIEDACRAAGFEPPIICSPAELLEFEP